MNFGPLTYNEPKGLYEEDPEVEAIRAKMEKALADPAARLVRRLVASKSWVIKKHGIAPSTMALAVQFSIVTAAEIESKARDQERRRLSARVWMPWMDALDGS